MTTFEVLAEPSRRRILDLLAQRERPVGDLVKHTKMSQPLVSKHLRILREAGLVNVRIDGQHRRYRVDAKPLKEIDRWLDAYRKFWTKKLDDLETHLGKQAKEEGHARNRKARR